MSNAETTLAWQLTAASIPFEREHRFHPERKWRFDFWIRPGLLAVECDGGSWVAGRHTRGAGFEADCEKYNEAAILGWRVLRVTPAMVDDGRALQWIERARRIAW